MQRRVHALSALFLAAITGGLIAQGPQHPVRCGTPERALDHVEADVPSDCAYSSTNPTAAYSPAAGPVYRIPVVFHVIRRTDGTGYISPAMLQSQIDILNEDFRALAGSNGAGGVDCRIEFVLAGYDYTTNNTWFRDRGTYYNTLAWDTNRYCNVYTNSAGGYLGYVPSLPQSGTLVGTKADRIVVLWSAVGRNAPYGAPYNQGRTLTHEMGHYLGLYHTFQGGCGTSSCYTTGDLICDTPAESTAHYGCSQTDSCSSSGVDPIRNYMNYTDDLCMNQFSEEQARRLRCTLTGWRPNLATTAAFAAVLGRTAGGNVASYTAAPARLGGLLQGSVDLLTTGHQMAALFGHLAPATTPLPGGWVVLVDTASPGGLLFASGSGPVAGFAMPIPADPLLEGLMVHTQAVHFGGRADFALSNAQDLILGWQ